MSDSFESRLASNESAFRKVNEAISRGLWPGEEAEPVAFRCECARLGCDRLIELTVGEYERVRANPRRFFLVPGHEVPEVERVVERNDRWYVVEKQDHAGEVAEAQAPAQQ